MKTKLVFLALLLMSAGAFAQTKEDETAIKAFLTQETKNAYALRQADYDAGYTNAAIAYRAYNTRSGYLIVTGVPSLTGSFGTRAREVNPVTENYDFRFYGPNAAFVTFDQWLYGKDTKPTKEIRMLVRQNGQWKLDAVVALTDYGQNKFEEDAVRKVVETETRAYFDADYALLTAQWSDKPYAERQQANLTGPTGAPFLKGEKLRGFGEAYFKTLKPSGSTSRISDYDVHISGATAWVTYTQEELDKAGNVVTKQREIRVLEREPLPLGWKIVFLGFQSLN